MANRREDGCWVDYLSALKTSLQFTHTFNSSSRQTHFYLLLVWTPKDETQLELSKYCMEILYNRFPVFLITIQPLLEQRDMQLCLIVQFVAAMCGNTLSKWLAMFASWFIWLKVHILWERLPSSPGFTTYSLLMHAMQAVYRMNYYINLHIKNL